jgi:hypothetical protein
MAKMNFEIRRDADKLVSDLTAVMQDNQSPSYTLGYIRYTLVDVLMDLPPAKREWQLRVLRKALLQELEHRQDRKDAA